MTAWSEISCNERNVCRNGRRRSDDDLLHALRAGDACRAVASSHSGHVPTLRQKIETLANRRRRSIGTDSATAASIRCSTRAVRSRERVQHSGTESMDRGRAWRSSPGPRRTPVLHGVHRDRHHTDRRHGDNVWYDRTYLGLHRRNPLLLRRYARRRRATHGRMTHRRETSG